MELETAIANTLKENRKKAGLSQERLALDSDLDRTFVSLLERGKRLPSLKSLFKISNALSTKPSIIVAQIELLLQKD